MLEEELIQLVKAIQQQRCEKQYIEVKSAVGGIPTKLYPTLSSFSNQEHGGTIVFGLAEEQGYEIVGVYDAQDLQKKVTEQANQMVPTVRPLFTVATIGTKIVVSAEIAECEIVDKPCFYKGAGRVRGSFVRVGESDQPMNAYEVYSFEAFKQRIHDDRRAVDGSTRADFDRDTLAEYLIKVRRTKPNLSNVDDDRLLEMQGMTNNGTPSVAGLLVLGTYPQQYFPQLSVTAVVVPGLSIGDVGEGEERFIDNKRFEGTISQMLEGALMFVRRHMQVKTIIGDDGHRSDVPEYPLKAVREILLNALSHRDYSIHTQDSPIQLVMHKDRLELENPGSLYGRLTLETLGKAPAVIRNPFLTGALEVMEEIESRFSGIPTIRDELNRAKLPPPVFSDQRGSFKVTFNNEHSSVSIQSGLDEEIISFCRVARTREELAAQFGYESVGYFTTHYILPLVGQGRLKMTLPNKPRSKFQKFYA
ncbi:MAG: ATP-binding protein [Sphaerochaeta sp.]